MGPSPPLSPIGLQGAAAAPFCLPTWQGSWMGAQNWLQAAHREDGGRRADGQHLLSLGAQAHVGCVNSPPNPQGLRLPERAYESAGPSDHCFVHRGRQGGHPHTVRQRRARTPPSQPRWAATAGFGVWAGKGLSETCPRSLLLDSREASTPCHPRS